MTVGDLKLRPYQIRIIKHSLQCLKETKRLRIYWVVPMGGGKTFMGISILHSLFIKNYSKANYRQLKNSKTLAIFNTDKSLVKNKKTLKRQNRLVRDGYKYVNDITIITYVGSAQAKWLVEIQHSFKYTHNIIIFNKQSLPKRIAMWFLDIPQFDHKKPTIFLCRIHTLGNDLPIFEAIFKEKIYTISLILIDEAHTLLNRKTKLNTKMLSLTHEKHCKNVICMTGTDQSRGLTDIFSILKILDRSKYTSYWKFSKKWLNIYKHSFGTKVEGLKNNVKEHLLLELNYRYNFVSEEEATKYIPSKIRKILYFDLDVQTRLKYNELAEFGYVTFKDKVTISSKGLLVKELRLRQLTCTPYLLTQTLGYGNALQSILEHSFEHALKNCPHIMLGTTMAEAIPFFETFFRKSKLSLTKRFKPENVLIIDDYTNVYPTLKRFEALKKAKQPSILIVSIIKSIGWDLPSCSNAYALIPSYNDLENRQWEDRMARGEATKVSTIHYLVANDTTNNKTIEILNKKNKDVQELTRKKAINEIK